MKWAGIGARLSAVSLLALCAACGGGGESGDGGGNPPAPPAPAPPAPPPPTGIGASGGTVTEASGAKVVVPAGALTTSTAIAVTQTSTGAPALPAGVTAFGPIYAFTPHGTAFATPVTITVPFDPSSVPAGTTPVLYKTDAALTTWAVVSDATVSGNTMVGAVTGFSDAVVGSLPKTTQISPTMKSWHVELYDRKGNRESLLQGDKTGGPLEIRDSVGPVGEFPTYWVHSTESGRTFWTQSVAPVYGGSYIGARTSLTQTYYFRVDQESPTLHFLITHASIDMFDGGGAVPSPEACPWLPLDPTTELFRISCNGTMTRAEAAFRIEARSLAANPLLYRAGGTVEVTGVHADWRPLVAGDFTEHALFRTSDFVFNPDADGGGNGRSFTANLIRPKRVDLPISTLHKGDIFSVQIFIKTTAIDHIQGESLVGALLQDPLEDAGIDLETSGLTELPPQPDNSSAPPALSCTTGPNPAAGVLQWSQPTFAEPERSESALIYVDRVGGTSGEVSVRVRTSDAAATTGADYQPVSLEIRFADGDDSRRRIEVPLVNDDAAEPDEALTVSLSEVGGCAQLGDTTNATLTILDDDRPLPVRPTYTLGGTVTGLAGSGLALRTNFINDVAPAANGPFTFPRRLNDGTIYSVSIESQPTSPAQICTLTNGNGTITGADVSNVLVSCTTPPPASGLDQGFGLQGKVFSTLGSARVLAQQGDGKLLALGSLTLTRYNTDGTVDTSFGSGGKVDIVANGSAIDRMAAVAAQPDGKIVVAGKTSFPTVPNDDFVALRFNPDGSPDGTFGTGGKVVTDFEGHRDEATSVLLQSDGKIVLVGDAQIGKIIDVGTQPVFTIDQEFAAVRYLSNGTPDPAFGNGGKATLDAGGLDYVNAGALQFDGGIIAVGRSTVSNGTGNPDMAVARFLANGIPDPAFGNGGAEHIDFASGVVPPTFNGGLTDEALDVAIDGDGRILVAGYALGTGNVSVAALFRLSGSGALDQNIGPSVSSTIDRVNAIALQGDGKILIAGTGQGDFGLERFTTAGVPDESFGSHGLMTFDFFGAVDAAFDVLVQSDGRIVAGGTTRNGTSGGAGLVRVLP